jgi:ABC-type multidrug transport system ATPase subunit
MVLPTEEQQRAVELFGDGKSLKINVFAGAGKTTTLKMIADYSDRSGLYLAFNKSIANDAAQRFPKTVACQTTHSLAFRATRSEYRRINGKMTDRLNANAVAELLGLKELRVGSAGLSEWSQGNFVLTPSTTLICI